MSSVPGEQKGFRLRGIGLGAVFAALLLGAISLFGQNVQLGSLIPTFAIFVLVTLTVILAFKSSRRARDLERLIEKQARELKASEELGRLSLASASQGIYDLNVQTGDVNVSPEYAAMLGYDPDDYSLTFDSWVEQVHPDDREDTLRAYRNYSEGKTAEYRVEFREHTKSGDWKWILSVGQFVEWDEGGNPTRMLGTHTDITEQVETKIELARLARFPEENPNPVLRLNEQRNVLYANDAARRTLDSGLMDDAAFREAFDSAVGGDSPVRGEVKLGEVYYAVSIVPLAGMGLLNVYGFDITKRKNAEKETNLLARFPSENPNPVMRLSEEGELLYSNEACSYLLRHGVRGNSVFRAGISTALEMGSPERIEMRVGDLFYMLTIAPIPELQAVNVYGMDVTARQKTFDSLIEAEARLKETVSELQRSNYDLEQFAYISSHDLQEPLRMVSNYVQLLERRYKNRLDDEADEFIGYAVDGVRRMNELIEGLLEYSRIQNRSRQNESVDCNALLKTILHDSARTIMQSDGRVTADPLPIISGDRIQLGRVFQNIIANALKFHGEQPPEVHVSALDEGSCWHFKISDNGIGIEPEYAEKIFGLFKRLHGREKYTGTGIGLAVCKRIIERHGGRIWVEPGTEAGCVFHFTLQKEGHHET